MPSEAAYQNELVRKLHDIFPSCFVTKNDPSEVQGVPDLLILFEDQWAMLEVKLSADAPIQPNQAYYVDKFNEMGFAAFVYPENEVEVLDALQSAFRSRRQTRLFEPQ